MHKTFTFFASLGRSWGGVTPEDRKARLLQAQQRIHLFPEHVPGKDNIADSLSRGDVSSFLAAFPAATTKLSIPLPDYLKTKLTSL